MKNSFLSGYIFSHLISIRKHLEEYPGKKNPEQVHRLRVDIKKLRAVFSFLNKTRHKRFHKKALKGLFDKAGTLRELQLNMQFLNKFSHSENFLTSLKLKEERLSTQFINEIPRHIKTVENLEIHIHVAEIPSKKELKNYFKKQINKAEGFLHEKDLHHFRMRLKRMMYVYNMLPKELQKPVSLNKGYINKLQKLAGSWHDSSRAAVFFRKIRYDHLKEMKEKEKKQFDSLIKRCRNFSKEVYS